ncbi:adenylate/guanylate cyclase domain-containing protein [Leptolyngbyaceae cyanobacterium UHCC 1019]
MNFNSMPDNTRSRLHQLLQERIEYPERESEIDTLIHQTFDHNCAILVLDLSGFSRLTIRHGIIHFLTMVHRMSAIANPIVIHHQGRVIKQEADNLFAVFSEVPMAVDAAVDILKGFAAVNTGLPDEKDLHASIGIGYGTTLLIGDSDLYGSEMNLASKLGEDLAHRNEILLTEQAFQQLADASNQSWEQLSFSISGLELISYVLR